MKYLGLGLVAVGVAFLVFALYSFFKSKNRLHSPVPYHEGVKVIMVNPN